MFWCEKIKQSLIEAHQSKRLPHALLFLGQEGLGKKELAQQFASYFLCSSPNKKTIACGKCTDCLLLQAQTHGDFYSISPETSKNIGIDQIRSIKKHAYQTSQRGQAKIFILADADCMTISAGNALLKILEEPPSHCFFILTSQRKEALPATILSRCQSYGFTASSTQQIAQWLSSATEDKFSPEMIKAALFFSSGAPLLAKQLLEQHKVEEMLSWSEALKKYLQHQINKSALYKILQGKPFVDILNTSYIVCYDLLRTRNVINKNSIYSLLENIIKIKKLLSLQIALNEALLLELLLFF